MMRKLIVLTALSCLLLIMPANGSGDLSLDQSNFTDSYGVEWKKKSSFFNKQKTEPKPEDLMLNNYFLIPVVQDKTKHIPLKCKITLIKHRVVHDKILTEFVTKAIFLLLIDTNEAIKSKLESINNKLEKIAGTSNKDNMYTSRNPEKHNEFLQVFIDEKIMAQDLKEHILEVLEQL